MRRHGSLVRFGSDHLTYSHSMAEVGQVYNLPKFADPSNHHIRLVQRVLRRPAAGDQTQMTGAKYLC